MPTPIEALDGVANACQILPNVLTGGQPAAANLQALKEAGVRVVLDARDPMEPRPIDEPELVRQLGMEYVNVPVTTGALTEAMLDGILGVLRGAGDGLVYFHCASGNRAAGAMIAYLMVDHGLAEDEAVGQAMRAGLRSAELMEWGLEYARRKM